MLIFAVPLSLELMSGIVARRPLLLKHHRVLMEWADAKVVRRGLILPCAKHLTL
jgi:hypothetical protein